MGKKSKYKKIRKIAANLPEIQRRAVIGSKVKGCDLNDDKDWNGNPINPSAIYTQKEVVAVPSTTPGR